MTAFLLGLGAGLAVAVYAGFLFYGLGARNEARRQLNEMLE